MIAAEKFHFLAVVNCLWIFCDDGQATVAKLNQPSKLSFDTSGNLYFIDSTNRVVRKVDALTCVITTVAGNGYTGASYYSGEGGPERCRQDLLFLQ